MKHNKRQAIYQYSVAYFLILILSSTLTKIYPGAGVIAVWSWYLIPGYLLSFFIKGNLPWYTRLPFALAIGVGLFSPITILSILLRFDLNIYLGLFIFCYILVALSYYLYAPEPSNSPELKVEGITSNWPFLTIIAFIVIGLIFLSQIWPLAGDDLAGLPLYTEVLTQDKILGTEPFHGTGTPVTPRNELVVQGYQMIMLAKVGDLIPNDLFIFSRAILIPLSFLAVYTFISEWYQNKRFGQLILVVWGLYLLATLQFDKDGSNFVTRIYQDKFSGWFVVIPVLLTLFIWYIREKNIFNLLFLGIGSLGLALTHPVTFMILLLLIGSYSILHLLFNWSKQEFTKFIWVGLILAICLLVPIIQYIRYIGPMPVDIAGLSDAVTYSRSFMAVNRFRLLFLDDGSYILHPSIITQPIVLLGLLLSIFLVPETRKTDGTKLAISAMVIISLVLYIPFLANIMGKLTTPYLLWRLAWPYSLLALLVISEASLKSLDHISKWVKSTKVKTGLKRYKEIVVILVAIIIALPSFSTGIVEFNQRIGDINYSPCVQAKQVLHEIENLTRNQSGNILASSRLNLCIPGAAGLANVIEYRGLGTVNRLPEDQIDASFQRIEDINTFTNSTTMNMQVVYILERYDIDFILVDRDRIDFEMQLIYIPESFKLVYTDENYALYKVVNIPEESSIVAGNEALRQREWEIAEEYFLEELEIDKSQPLAYLGLANVHSGEGDLEEALNYLMLAQWYAPEEAGIYAQISEAYLLLQDIENSITNLEKAAELAPNRKDLWISLGTLQYFSDNEGDGLENLEKGFSIQAEYGSANYFIDMANHLTRINWETEAINYYQKALSISSDPVTLTNYATSLAQMHDTTEAIKVAQQATKLSRWDYRPYLLLGQINQELGNVQLAQEMYQRVLALNPHHSYAYSELAKIIQDNSGFSSAEEYMRSLEETNPSLPGPHTALATLYLMQGDTENAILEYENVQKIIPRNASIETIMGYLNLVAEDYEEANRFFTDTLEENPQSVPSILGLAKIYSIYNDPSKEIGLRYQIVRENPLAIWPHISLARTFSRLGDWQKAEKTLTFSINLNSNEESAWMMLGDFYMTRADWPSAQLAYFEAQNLDPNNVDLLIRMGRAYWFAGNLSAATRYFEEAILKDPDLNEAHLALANVLWLEGSEERSIEILDEMLTQNTITIADLNTAIQLVQRQGRTDIASELYGYMLTSYSNLSTNFPEFAELEYVDLNETKYVLNIEESLDSTSLTTTQILIEGANFFNEQGNWETAQNALRLARSLSPEDPSAYIAEAENYRMRGESALGKNAIDQATELFPDSPKIYMWLAENSLVQSDLATAKRHLQTAKNLDPTLLEPDFLLASIYRAEGNFESASALLEETRENNPGSAEALQKLIEFSIFIGKIEEAKKLLEAGVEIFPTASSLLTQAADFYLQLGEFSEAEKYYQRAVSVDPENIQSHIALGKFYEQRNRTKEALDTYNKATSIDRRNIQAIFELSRFYLSQKNENASMEILEDAITDFPGISSLHIQLGDIYLQTYNYEQAQTQFELACELDKTNYQCKIGLGEVLLQQGYIDDGEKFLQSAIDTAPSGSDAYLVLADFYRMDKRLAEAEILYQTALAQTLNKSAVYVAQAEMFYLEGNIQASEEAYLNGWLYTPTSANLGLELIRFYKHQNNLPQAKGVLEKITTYYPNQCEVELEAADLQALNLELEAAEKIYLEIIDTDPLCTNAYEGLSTVYSLLGKTDLALQVHINAANNLPNNPLVLTRSGDYYYSRMLYEDAKTAYQNALQIEENNLEALVGLEKVSLAENAEIQYRPALLLEYANIVSPQNAANLALALQEFYLWDEAYELIEDTLAITPYNSLAWFALGNHYQNKMNYSQALEAYQIALQNPTTHKDSLLAISNLYLEMGEFQQAETTYRETLALYPGSFETYFALSEFFKQTDQTEIAEEILLEGIADGPKDLLFFETLASLYLENSKISEAEEITLIGLENYPGSDGLQTTLGDIYANGLFDLIDQIENYNAFLWWYQYLFDRIESQKLPENARRERLVNSRLRKIEQEIQTASENLKAAQTDLDEFQANIDKSKEAYNTALSINPSNETALLRLGRMESVIESNNAALPYFQAAVTANPNSQVALRILGIAYLTEKDPEKAIPLFERSIAIDPTQTLAYMGKFRALKESNEDGILLGSELTELGQFWYGSLIERFRIIIESDYQTGAAENYTNVPAEEDARLLNIPPSWQARQSTFDASTISTFVSPDNHAVIQLIVFDDGNYVNRTLALEFALALLQETYGEQINISQTEILDDRENLIWATLDSKYAGVTGFTIRGNEIVILTSMYDLPYAEEYQELLSTIANQIQLGDPVYPSGQ